MEKIVEECGNVEFSRKKWMDRNDQLEMLRSSDVYIAPFRSEGFGIPIVEAMLLGLSVIASVGGTAADDYMSTKTDFRRSGTVRTSAYPVRANETECYHYPCEGNNLCVFSPCKDHGGNQGWKCACERLVKRPTWFEVDRAHLREQMKQVYEDLSLKFGDKDTHDENTPSQPARVSDTLILTNKNTTSFCWSKLGNTYHDSIVSVLKSPRKRSYHEYKMVNPDAYNRRLRRHQFKAMRTLCIILSIVAVIYFKLKNRSFHVAKLLADIRTDLSIFWRCLALIFFRPLSSKKSQHDLLKRH